MDIKIETATVTADKDNQLDEKWTVEIEDIVCCHFDDLDESLMEALEHEEGKETSIQIHEVEVLKDDE